jgi:hypothetical protein
VQFRTVAGKRQEVRPRFRGGPFRRSAGIQRRESYQTHDPPATEPRL